jgi:hypothetical protein
MRLSTPGRHTRVRSLCNTFRGLACILDIRRDVLCKFRLFLFNLGFNGTSIISGCLGFCEL